jgi:hypothetical protein
MILTTPKSLLTWIQNVRLTVSLSLTCLSLFHTLRFVSLSNSLSLSHTHTHTLSLSLVFLSLSLLCSLSLILLCFSLPLTLRFFVSVSLALSLSVVCSLCFCTCMCGDHEVDLTRSHSITHSFARRYCLCRRSPEQHLQAHRRPAQCEHYRE